MGLSTDALPREQADPHAQTLPLAGIVWFCVLLLVCYAPILYNLVNQWMNDDDMSHGFFVPVIAGYIAWQKRDELFSKKLTGSPVGLVVLLLAALQALAGTLGAELFTSRTAFVFSIIGSVLYLGGWQALKILRFPLFLMFLMVPIPAIIYNTITFPLQLLASQVAEHALTLLGIPVVRDGNVLDLPSQKLSVVEACSGIRSLLALSFLSLVYGYFSDQRTWMRWLLFVATVPIAIASNASRVTLTGVLSEINTEYAHGIYHSISGMVTYIVALVILLAFHKAVSKVADVVTGK